MPDFESLTPFFGRFHPLVVHLPIGFLVVLAVTGVLFRRASVKAVERVLLVLVVAASGLAIWLGFLLARGGEYDATLLFRHRWIGVGVGVGCLLCLVLHAMSRFKTYGVALLLTLGAVGVGGHYGGSLTHGSGYLVQHMPGPMRAALGLPPREDRAPRVVTDSLAAPVYEAVVRPVFARRCVSCHGAEKTKGRLRLDTPAGILGGGRGGALVSRDAPDGGTLLQRIHLPADHEEHMPPPGKPQLTAQEKEVLSWWASVGGPVGGTVEEAVAESGGTEDARLLLDGYFGLAEPPPPPRPLEELAPEAERLAHELGVLIQPHAEGRPELDVSVLNVAASFGDAELAQLRPLAANITTLSLAGSRVTDAGLATLAAMPHLTKLWLDRTAVTDAGLVHLHRLRKLSYLNLYGTAVTDAGLSGLSGLKRLRQVYVWETRVTPEAAAAFMQRSVDPGQIRLWEQEILEKQRLIEDAGVRVELGGGVKIPAAPPPPAPAH